MPGVPDSLVSTWVSGKDTSLCFENYEVLQELPQGGQAVVYKAVHKPTKTHVALKILLPTLVASTRARYYFEREAEVIAALDHPNIVRIRDSGIIHGQYFFVMEYVDGQPLDRYAQTENLSFRERIKLFNKVCAAVTYAHQQGIIHRDLKFANILIDKRGEPHILDFGLAKAIGMSELARKDAMPTITGQWSGSLSNMSPEQAAAKPELIDVRTDVYALGAMLYYLLTNRYPYDVTGSTLEVLQNIQKAEPARPRTFIRRFDSDVEAILLTALAKDREQRYQSVADFRGDIDNWLQGRPIRVRSISTIYLLRKIIMRHRYTSAVAGLLLLIILSFAYISFDLYLSAERERQEAEAIAKQWSSEGARLVSLTQELMPLTFAKFIQAWREGKYGQAHAIALYLKDKSKEKSGFFYLTIVSWLSILPICGCITDLLISK
jgi:serine/threonine protein kinase